MNTKAKSTLEKFRKILKLKNYADTTIKMYVYYVNEFVMSFNKPALHITAKEVKYYIENYNYSSISKQNQVYSAIKQFSRHILNIKKLENIILERPRKEKKLPQVIDHELLKEKIMAIPNLKHKSILMLGYSCAMRVSEVVNLKIADIDSDRMLINIRNGKGAKDRIVKLSQTVLETLREYYRKFKPVNFLFNGQFKEIYSTTSCNKLVKKYIGVKYHFHTLRHSSATTMLEKGTDISIIQKLLGHNNVKTTMIYTHISQNIIQQSYSPI